MIKHCQDKSTPHQEHLDSAHGLIMGVLKKEIDEQYLLVTATVPQSKRQFRSLKQIQDMEKDQAAKDDSTNSIGFYVSCQLGMAFSHKNLLTMIAAYRNFRNSCMVVYDVTKSPYGLNPLKCFRLSQSAIESLNLNNPAQMTN